jgi:hypothetical protein
MGVTWRYRVVHRRLKPEDDGPPWLDEYAIHEVYFTDEGEVRGITEHPTPVIGEDVAGLGWTLDKMRRALEEPVVEYATCWPESDSE